MTEYLWVLHYIALAVGCFAWLTVAITKKLRDTAVVALPLWFCVAGLFALAAVVSGG